MKCCALELGNVKSSKEFRPASALELWNITNRKKYTLERELLCILTKNHDNFEGVLTSFTTYMP